MVFQQCSAIGLNFVCITFIGGEVWAIKPIARAQVKRLMFPTCIFVCMLICSLKALKTVHVATVVVARNLCTVLICLGESMFFGKSTARSAVFGLFVIVLGSVVYGFTDLTFEPVGYFWQACNSVMFISAQLIEKWAMTQSKADQTPLGMSTIKNSLSLPVLGCMMAFNGDWNFAGVDQIPRLTWFFILLTGIGCCCLSIVYMMLYKLASATAIAVGGNFNKVVSIILAAYLFNQSMGIMQVVGLGISLLGSLHYSLETSRPRDKAKPA